MADIATDIGYMLRAMARPIVKVYPAYLAIRIRNALRVPDPEGVFSYPSDIERIGDAKDAIYITDFNGTRYRITVEVLPDMKPAPAQACVLDGPHSGEIAA